MKKFILLTFLFTINLQYAAFFQYQCTNHQPGGYNLGYGSMDRCCDFLNPKVASDGTIKYWFAANPCWKGSCNECNNCKSNADCPNNGCCDLSAGKGNGKCLPQCKDGSCQCYEPKRCDSDDQCVIVNKCCNLKAITTDKQTCQPKCKDGSCACWKFKNLGEVCYTNFDCDTNQHHYCGDMKLDKTKGTLAGICKKD